MDNFKQFQELFSSINFDPVITVGIIVIIAIFIIECVLLNNGYINTRSSKKRVEKAQKLNHIIKAKRISYWDDYKTSDDRLNSYYHAKYEYTINNKNKKYRYLSKKHPPLILNLYYLHNPNRVFHYEEKTSVFAILFYIIPIALGIIVMKLLGFNPQ
ncbi:MAG: hypothetical protein UFP41_00935 [Bacilli bacterium]|nr:hypothetical protein [Bacilli bacterium]